MPMGETLKYTKMRARLPAAYGGDSHLLAMARVTPNGRVDTTLVERHTAYYKGKIALDHFVPLHLFCERRQCAGVFRYYNQPGCVFIQAMDDTWPLLAADVAAFRAIGQQGIDICIVSVTRSRVYDHTSLLINNQQV